MKKLTVSLLLILAVGTVTSLLLPRFSAYREWRTKTDVYIAKSTRMEIQDSWIVESPNKPRLFRIRARWMGNTPFDKQIVTASLTNKNGEAVYLKKWYVPLAPRSANEDGELFMWEFELPAGKKLDHDLILELSVHPNKDYASTPAVSKVPLPFFGAETTSFTIFPFRSGS